MRILCARCRWNIVNSSQECPKRRAVSCWKLAYDGSTDVNDYLLVAKRSHQLGLRAFPALISHALLRRNRPGPRPELSVGVVILIVLLGIAFAAGYFTRDLISRKRHAEARRWRGYAQPDWVAVPPANTNEVSPPAVGELGQMLDRWESRARARRTG